MRSFAHLKYHISDALVFEYQSTDLAKAAVGKNIADENDVRF